MTVCLGHDQVDVDAAMLLSHHLRRRAEELHDAADVAVHESIAPTDVIDGDAGDAFRRAAAHIRLHADVVAWRHESVGRALDTLIDGMQTHVRILDALAARSVHGDLRVLDGILLAPSTGDAGASARARLFDEVAAAARASWHAYSCVHLRFQTELARVVPIQAPDPVDGYPVAPVPAFPLLPRPQQHDCSEAKQDSHPGVPNTPDPNPAPTVPSDPTPGAEVRAQVTAAVPAIGAGVLTWLPAPSVDPTWTTLDWVSPVGSPSQQPVTEQT